MAKLVLQRFPDPREDYQREQQANAVSRAMIEVSVLEVKQQQ